MLLAADGVEHAVPDYREVRDGLAHLATGGFVRKDGRGFIVTIRSRRLLASKRRGNEVDYVARRLGSARRPTREASRVRITEAADATALARYLERAAAVSGRTARG
jgi:hypothetical protein